MVSPKWLEPKRLSAKQALRAAGLGAHIGGLPSQASQELNALGPEQAVTRRPLQPRPAQPCMDESADSREEGGREFQGWILRPAASAGPPSLSGFSWPAG